jgi:predicted Zn-dependent protease with MMP-like domain
MTYDLFRQTVETMLSEIPEEFLEGLQGVHVLETTKLEPDLGDVYRLGEYLDPGQDSFLGSNPGLGRHITLYYGSFVTIAKGHSDFDWEEEIWETLVHELRHHVESLAGDASLIAEDQRRDATFRKQLGKK